MEPLLRGVEMVELERPDITVVAANRARASGFLHQHLLDPTAPAAHLLRATLRAAHAMAVADELDRAVARAGAVFSNEPRGSTRATMVGLEVVASQPIPNRRIALRHPRGDLADGQALLHQCRERCAIHRLNDPARPGRKNRTHVPLVRGQSWSPRSRSASFESFSFERVRDSIWRTRSRVTPTWAPMSSSVIGPAGDRP